MAIRRLSTRFRVMNGLALLSLLIVGVDRFLVLGLFGEYQKVAIIGAFVFAFLVIYFTMERKEREQTSAISSEPGPGEPVIDEAQGASWTPAALIVAAIVLILPLVVMQIVKGEAPGWGLIAMTEFIALICLVSSWKLLNRDMLQFRHRRRLKMRDRKKPSA